MVVILLALSLVLIYFGFSCLKKYKVSSDSHTSFDRILSIIIIMIGVISSLFFLFLLLISNIKG